MRPGSEPIQSRRISPDPSHNALPQSSKPRGNSMETESKQSTGADASAMPWLNNLKELIDKYHLPGVDVAALVDWQRKDMEALAEANRQAFEGTKALIN